MKMYKITITGGGSVKDWRVQASTMRAAVGRALAKTFTEDPPNAVCIEVGPAAEGLILEATKDN